MNTYVIEPFKKSLKFRGRTSRRRFWMFQFFIFLGLIIVLSLSVHLKLRALVFIYLLCMLFPVASITTRRLHDVGRSGWWVLLALVPIVGQIVLIGLCLIGSHPDNHYGPRPKETLHV